MFGRSIGVAGVGVTRFLRLALIVVAPQTDGQSQLSGDAQTAAFVIAAEATAKKYDVPMFIDPRSIRIDMPDRMVLPDTLDYLPVTVDALQERSKRLIERGMTPKPALPLLHGCNGHMVPPGFRRTSECPAAPLLVVAFGPVRIADQRQELWELRKMEVHYGPHGRGITIFRVVLRYSEGAWEVVGEEELVTLD